MGCLNRTYDAPTALASKPFNSLNRTQRRRLALYAPLEHALHMSGIARLDRPWIQTFMQKKLEKLQDLLKIKTVSVRRRMRLSLYGGILMLMGGLIALLCRLSPNPIPFFIGTFGGMFILVQSLHYCQEAGCLEERARQMKWSVATWDDWLKNHFQEPVIPAEVTAITKEIKMRCPKAELNVHYLDEDPFLEAMLVHPETGRREEFFVAFWDENGFIPAVPAPAA